MDHITNSETKNKDKKIAHMNVSTIYVKYLTRSILSLRSKIQQENDVRLLLNFALFFFYYHHRNSLEVVVLYGIWLWLVTVICIVVGRCMYILLFYKTM